MDILLTHGYFLAEDSIELKIMRPYPPLGILYISSYLKSKNFDVEIFDSTFSSKAEFFKKIKTDKPNIVGVYCNLMTKLNVLPMIKFLKEQNVTVILGGPEPAQYARNYLDYGADFVVSGEGEQTLEELIPILQSEDFDKLPQVKGITFKDVSGSFCQNEQREQLADLDLLPLPDRESIDIPKYVRTWRQNHGFGAVSLITARGCPFHCKWCSHEVYGRTHRRRSPEKVIEEIERIKSLYFPDFLWYADDVFTINRKWLFEFEEKMKAANLKFPFECISRADRMNEEIVSSLANLGCRKVWIGSESGSQKILDAMSRGVKVEQVRDAMLLAQNKGIQTGMFLMWGYEGEEIEDIEATIKHVKETNPDTFLTTLSYPIKGTTYFKDIEEKIFTNKNWEERTDRNLNVEGRFSKRFYKFVDRRLNGEVSLHRLKKNNSKDYFQIAKAFVNSHVGKLGMNFYRIKN